MIKCPSIGVLMWRAERAVWCQRRLVCEADSGLSGRSELSGRSVQFFLGARFFSLKSVWTAPRVQFGLRVGIGGTLRLAALNPKALILLPDYASSFLRQYCVAIHDNGDIYVGSNADCIYVFDQTGQLKNTIASHGSGDGQLNKPYGTCICIKGDVLYVADGGNHCVQKLTSRGEFLHKFGQQGSGQGQLYGPKTVIIDPSNRLFVSDWGNHRIQIFTEDGGWLLTIDGKGSGNYFFQMPWRLALDPQGNIYVAAFGSNAIKVFTKEGVYVRTYGDPHNPIGIAIDGEGYSLVSEYRGNCLSIFHSQGNKIHTVGDLNKPDGISLDPRDGSVYVANRNANTVLKYYLL